MICPENTHMRVLRKPADIIARPLSIDFEKPWKFGDVPENCKKVTKMIQRLGNEEKLRELGLLGETSSPCCGI